MNTARDSQLAMLWESLALPTSDHVVRLFARSGTGKLLGDYASCFGELKRFVDVLDGNYNLYVALNPTTTRIGTRHNAEDVTHWSFFPIDIDPDVPDAPVGKVMDLVLDGMRSTFNLTHSPTCIDSGRGRQIWYRLSDYSLRGGLEPHLPRRAMRYWLGQIASWLPEGSGCKIDPTVSDLPRVMRMPGTINLKTGRRAAFIGDPGTMFPELGTVMISKTPEKELDASPAPMVLSSYSGWKEVVPYLTVKNKNYLFFGASEPGRHTAMWHLVKSLHEHGLEEEEAEAAAHFANIRRGEDEALPTREVEKIITQVYGG